MHTKLFAAALLCAAGAATAQDLSSRAPEASSGYTEKTAVVGHRQMVAAANPHAADAGYRILKRGGTAVDAAIATQLVLTLVEPQSSGIGGGAFMLHADRAGRVRAYDGRETAPSAATESLFLDANGKPLGYREAVVGGRSVGAPGVLRMLELAHKAHGKLPWKTLFEPAIALAKKGFAVSPRMHASLKAVQFLKTDPVAAAYFHGPDGQPWPVGHVLKNPELARTLEEIARGGADAFYKGRIARDIAAKVQGHPTNPGLLTAQDIAAYQAKECAPVCMDYKAWTVCGMPPPSSGGVAVAQILGILANKDMAAQRPVDGLLTAEAVHLFTEAGRLAYADRARYIGDTDFVPVPGGVQALLDPAYLAGRAALIGPMSMGVAQAGVPAAAAQVALGQDRSPEYNSTSHFSIVDAHGNAVAMTTSVEDGFGSRQMVDGFLLNNQLTDFSAVASDEHGPVANRVQPGKRPRSAMSPTLVFDRKTKQTVLTVGSPGGSAIINYVAKVLVGTLDWGMNVQQAISLPNIGSRNGPTELEAGRVPQQLVDTLKARGHNVRVIDQNSGLQGIARVNAHGKTLLVGGADPRREGAVRGD